MKKLAVYVEGHTEQAFVEKLLLETAKHNGIQIRKEERTHGAGGSKRVRKVIAITGAKEGHDYYAQIVNCTNDDRVTSDLREEYPELVKAKFNAIIALRDARGEKDGVANTIKDVPLMKYLMGKYVPTKDIKPTQILAVMETEAWFIAEHTHFHRIDDKLNLSDVASVVKFDPSAEPHRVEELPMPANDLDVIYQRASKRYAKDIASIQRTVDALDIPLLSLDFGMKVPELKPLIDAVGEFLA